jgi:hypothetical protein
MESPVVALGRLALFVILGLFCFDCLHMEAVGQ